MDQKLLDKLVKGIPAAGPDPLYDYFAVKGGMGANAAPAEALVWMQQNLHDDVKKTMPKVGGKEHELVLLNGNQIVWRLAKQRTLEGTVGDVYVNAGFDWLTYETVLNKPKFRKTNQKRPLGLYAADVSDMQVWVREQMPANSTEAIAEAFFPDHTLDEVKQLSRGSWWWKRQPDVETLTTKTAPYRKLGTAKTPPAVTLPGIYAGNAEELVGSRLGLRIHLPRFMVMPYNYWDNDLVSNALGTDPFSENESKGAYVPKHTTPLLQLSETWDFWRTASRSCVGELKRVKKAGDPWPGDKWTQWPFGEADTQRETFRNQNPTPDIYANTKFKAEVSKTEQFKLNARTSSTFSVKTGVCYVGFERQEGANKDVIGKDDEWFVGCMRSDTIQAIELLMGNKGGAKRDIRIQTEIFMALERRPAPSMEKLGVDGVALRDLTVMDTAKTYIPPLSIPFIDMDGKTLTQEFIHVNNPDWCAFWQRNWVEAVGRAKALFLVQYGMQHANPNVQNYLIEFSAGGKPTAPARIVIRDVADALVARQVMWALFGEDRPCPMGTDEHAALATAALPVLRYNFRNATQGKQNETGSTDVQFGPSGIQMLWQRFSTFYGAHKEPSKLKECPELRRAQVLRLLSSWLLPHAAAYVRTVEQALGYAFGQIRWDLLKSPKHDPDRFLAPVGSLEAFEPMATADMKWEEDAAVFINEYFADAGRTKICEYHNRGWVDATPTFVIRLLDDASEAIPHEVVYYESTDTTMKGMRVTDPEGKIPFYSKAASDFKFEVGRGEYTAAGAGDYTIAKVTLTVAGTSGNQTDLTAPPPVAPVVTITDPGPLSGSAAAVTATAVPDTGLTIDSVQFSLDGLDVGAPLTAAPFTASIDTTAKKNGKYPVKAVAKDSAALEGEGELQVQVENPLPVAAFSAPGGGSTIAGAAVAVTVTATPGPGMTLGGVVILVDGKPLADIAGTGPYSANLDATTLTGGGHQISAVARDTAGNESAAVEIDVVV